MHYAKGMEMGILRESGISANMVPAQRALLVKEPWFFPRFHGRIAA